MATIIQLIPQHRAATSLAIGDPPPPCQIVIFPGVRIEREQPAPTADVSDPDRDGADRPRKSS